MRGKAGGLERTESRLLSGRGIRDSNRPTVLRRIIIQCNKIHAYCIEPKFGSILD